MRILERIKIIHERFGTFEIFARAINKISYGFINFSTQAYFEKRKYKISKKISNSLGNKVISGCYQGMILNKKQWWGRSDVLTKLLGMYEQEVQIKINEILKNNKIKNFIDIGAADGFFAIGVKLKNPEVNVIAYELSNVGREFLSIAEKINNVQIEIHSEATYESLFPYRENKNLFLIDIEGDEYNLLNNKILEMHKKSFFIIELHIHTKKERSSKAKFISLCSDLFKTSLIKTGSRDFIDFDFLHDLSDYDRWILASEGRECMGEWLILEPKDI
tara:strand:+ start:56 stop:883 length:828 start_codon:yes stop_codon:yes gene_type:complete